MNHLTRLLYLMLLTLILQFHTGYAKEPKRCTGTKDGLSHNENRQSHLKKMKDRYENCTIVQGNLEITGLEDEHIDVSFLKDIEIVTGYVLIAINHVPEIILDNLKIIRGQELEGEGRYALDVAVNIDRQEPSIGLKRLGLRSLTEIQRGNVRFSENHLLCHTDTINWLDIMNKNSREKDGWTVTLNNTADPLLQCPKCHDSCKGHCWGPTAEDCQKLTSTICHPSCGNRRCRGPAPGDCCHRECASGCTGPSDTDCILCLSMNNSGVCQATCPQKFKYDPLTSRYVKNPYVKYHLDGDCVDKCPANMLVEQNACVKHCRPMNHNNGKGECVQCVGDACNKECFGIGDPDGPMEKAETIDSKNVHYFEGCNIVKGNVIFQAYAFAGDNHTGTPPMTAEQVTKAFSSVKIINGFLQILSWPAELHDFSVFSNLTTIRGVDLFRDIASLVIQGSTVGDGPHHLEQITSLGFRSLKSIDYGNVYIGYMRNLCYEATLNWTRILKNPNLKRVNFENGVMRRANKPCDEAKCHPACDANGCWGPGKNECLHCARLSYGDSCDMKCDKQLGIYQSGSSCFPCHEQCEKTCDGPGPGNCTRCKNFELNGTCRVTCPNNMYGDRQTKTCKLCNETCLNQRNDSSSPMCTGPAGTLGQGGCTYCNAVMADRHLREHECLPISRPVCPDAHYAYDYAGLKDTKRVCVPCIEGCRNCTGSTESDCTHALPQGGESAVVMTVVILVVSILLIAIVLFLIRHKRRKDEIKRQKSLRALGLEGGSPEPMTPSGVAPNKAQLRIVKETELRIGKILGTGAFGTVHNGYWIPDLAPREKVRVPVAIKVLRDESSQVQSNEILDEAFVMASCEHPNLVRLLGISLSHKIMLITQLMPLGNLLEYVRDNKDNIGSQTLLNWCLQIAKGMCYLAEEKHLVHRDLAARNVLVKSPNHVRITDFGLAKLLDVNEDVYRAEGGKMPIKWLALESIQRRIFTQKSDVWSFGVTVWELMTFGKKPYENVLARQVYTLLERGERLAQPTICTIDVYMLMIKCWTVDPDSRPPFRDLVEEFSKMARDPQRYLVIPNDGSLPALPSPTNSEFFRSLKHEEDDFPLQDAEEYLHPPGHDAFAHPTANGGHFPLQPAPTRFQRKKQLMESRPIAGYPGRFVGSSSTTDSRLDSTITVMTNVPSESGYYPNGCSTPFGANTPGSNMTPNSTREGFPAFGRLSNRYSRDRVSSYSAAHHHQPMMGPRTQSDSSDVFLSGPTTQLKDVWGATNTQPRVPEHPIRAREDSANMRYSAEPRLGRQESRPNEIENGESAEIQEDKDGYLEPAEVVVTCCTQEYFDTVPFSTSSVQFNSDCSARYVRKRPSAMENPEYEPTFAPGECNSALFSRQHSIPLQDDDGYEVPMTGDSVLKSDRKDEAEYENICPTPKLSSGSGYPEEDENGYLMANANATHRRHSNSADSTSSDHRDSGVPSDGDEGLPLNPKNVKPADGRCCENDIVDASEATTTTPPAREHHSNNNDNSVNNPNYELLENMTDGGFTPMSDFIPKTHDPWVPADNHSFDPLSSFPSNNNTSPMRPKGTWRNPLKLTINCNTQDDIEDNIFVTPESARRGTANVKNLVGVGDTFDSYDSPGPKRRGASFGKLTPEFDEVTGRFVPRTYSEPDSGVGIEVGIDNASYHRLGSSGCEAGD